MQCRNRCTSAHTPTQLRNRNAARPKNIKKRHTQAVFPMQRQNLPVGTSMQWSFASGVPVTTMRQPSLLARAACWQSVQR